jgi:hypothetical protein
MSIGAVLLTHSIAHQNHKSPFFFSQWDFWRAKKRGNTHYCFDCGGDWGFTPGEGGIAINCESDKVTLFRGKKEILISEALQDPMLEPHITNSPGYPRHTPKDRDYEEWLTYTAHFDYSPRFVELAERAGFTVHRYNPMAKHDPVTHAAAVLDGIQEHEYAGEWFNSVSLPEDFPYVVLLT